MYNITEAYLSTAEIWLLITTLIYFLMNGAGIFETAVLVPKWTALPPVSFQILQGKYGLDLKTFWIATHVVHEITFIVAIVFCWQIETIRNGLLLLFALHFAIRTWTILYFAPNIMAFQKINTMSENNLDLQKRTLRWKQLNYIRMFLFFAVSIGLVRLCLQLFHLKH
jgi:hypothetical protein